MEMTLDVIVLAATFLISLGVLIGYTLSERALEARTRRQAAVQRLLNSQWQEIEAARQTIAQQQKASRRSRSDVDAKEAAPYRAAKR
ncbi:MAG: hypothetical protein ACRDTA_06790 [Pseudonocardiaceae bacterium]